MRFSDTPRAMMSALPIRSLSDVQQTLSFSISQPSRALNDYQTLGFTRTNREGCVIDGMLKWTGAGNGDQINYRFAQTGRTERNRQNQLYPEGVFPFAHQVLTDHLSGRTGGRSARCTVSSTCAKTSEVNSSNEYWVKASSPLHSDTRGQDLEDQSGECPLQSDHPACLTASEERPVGASASSS